MGQLVFQAASGGQVNLVGPNTASTFNLNVPAIAGTLVTTGDTGTVTSTMLASSVYTAPGTIGSGTANTGAFTSLTATSISDSGNLTFTGTGNRITGDFSNATQANRVAFQTSTTNGNTTLNSLPNGTGIQTALNFFDNSDPTNAGTLNLVSNTTEKSIRAAITGTGTYLPMTFYTNGAEKMRLDTSGNLGLGVSSPTAVFMLKAGTATASTAPLKFTSGVNLSTPEAGVIEYDGTTVTVTTDTNFKRGTVPITNYASGTGTALGTNTEATNAVLLPAANDTITLSVGTYFLDVSYIVTRGATSVTSATARINLRGTGAAVGSFSGMSLSAPTAGGATANFSFDAVNITTDNVLTAASTTAAGVYTISLRGLLKITTSGTIIPQYSLSANINAAGTVAKVLYFRLQQIDTQSAAAAGPAGTGWA
jgi:hypothetical protein